VLWEYDVECGCWTGSLRWCGQATARHWWCAVSRGWWEYLVGRAMEFDPHDAVMEVRAYPIIEVSCRSP
jgi:hypothetical protein